MSSAGPKIPVGSAPWLVQERRQADELVEMEVEEFGYSVRNEIEWLNEHMGDIFSSKSRNVTDIFKTPGKLRGKTPRTARKRNGLGERAPLTDIFGPNGQANASPAKNLFAKHIVDTQPQQDENNNGSGDVHAQELSKTADSRARANIDSGYHGTTDDEMDLDRNSTAPEDSSNAQKVVAQITADQASTVADEELRRITDETFVSAKEDLTNGKASNEDLKHSTEPVQEHEKAADAHLESVPRVEEVDVEIPIPEDNQTDINIGDDGLLSDRSSPAKPLLRKSSITFSSLPGREPLAHKKSMGARSSLFNQARSSVLGRHTGGKSLGGQQDTEYVDVHDEDHLIYDVDGDPRPAITREESDTTKRHNHSTTLRLQDRINMLGQSRDVRTSRSIPSQDASRFPPLYPRVSSEQPEESVDENAHPGTSTTLPVQPSQSALPEDDEDDWIQPLKATQHGAEASRPDLTRTYTEESIENAGFGPQKGVQAQIESQPRRLSSERPTLFGHKKAQSASVLTSPTRAAMAPDPASQKAISVSNPAAAPTGMVSTTPRESPKRGHLDGAVSATKAKLYSALRSAKGLFASSAGVSAEARLEALSPGPKTRQARNETEYFSDAKEAIDYPDVDTLSRVTTSESTAPSADGRRTRSSSEREKRVKDEEARKQKTSDELQKAREKERQKAAMAASKLVSPSRSQLNRQAAPSRTDSERSQDMPPPPPPKSMLPTNSQRLREPRRVAKPVPQAQSKPKPAPVTIRMHVPSQFGHRSGTAAGPSTMALSSSLNESLPPPPPPKPGLISKISSTSLNSTASYGTLRGANPSQTAKKALEAAAKKKDADDRAAQKKAERQREMEQRRAAKQEDERRKQEDEQRKKEDEKRRLDEEKRAEQRRRLADQQRREEAKHAADARKVEQENLERQRAEELRREQQRREQQRAQQDGFGYALKQEKFHAQTQAHPRADLGAARPFSRMLQHDGRPQVQINPAKPPKRAFEEEDDQQPPGLSRTATSYQQQDGKRRKTEEQDGEQPEARRSAIMGPPVRQSNIRKDNKFTHGYAAATVHNQHPGSMFVKAVTGQHQLQHGMKSTDTGKFAAGRIPFADAPNPPGPAASTSIHKTPGRQLPNTHGNKSAAKSSPHYPNPETINLPEIATDSEEEDSENEFQAPDWTESPALRQLLTQQQLVDPQSVFGPIAPLRMEEVFKNKERQKKFRERTSSANWNSGDKLTAEERLKDQAAREKMMQDGGWSFQLGQ